MEVRGVVDVVIPVRPARRFESLRYALRSIAVNLEPRRVWLIGARPEWARELEWIPDGARRKWDGLEMALRLAAAEPRISDRFVYSNDDIFVLEPLAEVPIWHEGPLLGAIRGTPLPTYRRGMLEADGLLKARGIAEPLSYELHVPIPMGRAELAAALETLERLPAGQGRSMYGNLAGIGGERHEDVKIYGRRGGIPAGPFVSTGPGSFSGGVQISRELRARFAAPCRYEADA